MEEKIKYDLDAIEYIAKIADGGMRDAITLMDKCLSYSNELTMDNVIKALGVADYETLFNLNDFVFKKSDVDVINTISDVYNSGMDLKLFIKTYFEFILDLNVFCKTDSLAFTKIPNNFENKIEEYNEYEWVVCSKLLKFLTTLQSEIKWEQNPKPVIIAKFMLFMEE